MKVLSKILSFVGVASCLATSVGSVFSPIESQAKESPNYGQYSYVTREGNSLTSRSLLSKKDSSAELYDSSGKLVKDADIFKVPSGVPMRTVSDIGVDTPVTVFYDPTDAASMGAHPVNLMWSSSTSVEPVSGSNASIVENDITSNGSNRMWVGPDIINDESTPIPLYSVETGAKYRIKNIGKTTDGSDKSVDLIVEYLGHTEKSEKAKDKDQGPAGVAFVDSARLGTPDDYHSIAFLNHGVEDIKIEATFVESGTDTPMTVIAANYWSDIDYKQGLKETFSNQDAIMSTNSVLTEDGDVVYEGYDGGPQPSEEDQSISGEKFIRADGLNDVNRSAYIGVGIVSSFILDYYNPYPANNAGYTPETLWVPNLRYDLFGRFDNIKKKKKPAISLTKEADKTEVSEAGEEVVYTITIKNTGDVTLYDVDLKDDYIPNNDRDSVVFSYDNGEPKAFPDGGMTVTLEPEEEVVVTYTHTVTADELDYEYLDNGAFTTGHDEEGTKVSDDDDWKIDVKDPPTPPIETPGDPHIKVTKEADTKIVDHVGQVIKYNVVITNDGDVDLFNVDLYDHLVINSDRDSVVFKREDGREIDLSKTDLAVGESITATYEYTVTEEDFKKEYIDNKVYTTGEDKDKKKVSDDDDWQIDVVRPGKPHISVTKEADTKVVDHVGQEIKYTVNITNDGEVDLHDVDLYDHLVINSDRDSVVFKREDGRNIDLDKTDLKIGETITAEYTYVVTDEDFKNEHLDNAVFTKGLDPDDNPVEDDDDWEIDVIRPGKPHISVVKEADTKVVDRVGQEIKYIVKITNDGEVDLHDVDLYDHLVINSDRDSVVFKREDGKEIELSKTDLKVGETITAEYTYVVTDEDFKNEHLDNAVFTKGLDPDDNPVEDDDKWEIDVVRPEKPHISVTKTGDKTEVSKAGEIIKYTVKITNDGKVDLHDVNLKDHLVITDDAKNVKFSKDKGRSIDLEKTDLAVGETITVTYDYEVKEEDLAHGYIKNAVFVEGLGPNDEHVSDDDDFEVVVKPGKPHISLTKTGDRKEVSKAGEVINYTVEITNDGDLDIKDLNLKDKLEAVNAKDVEIKKDGAKVIDLEKTDLAIGETMTVKYSYKVTEEDMKSKYLKNLAFVVGKATNGEELTAEDDFIVTVKPVEIAKTGVNNTTTVVGGLPIVGAIVLAGVSYGVYRKTKQD